MSRSTGGLPIERLEGRWHHAVIDTGTIPPRGTPPEPEPQAPADFAEVGDRLFYVADSPVGRDLWVLEPDGVTRVVKDFDNSGYYDRGPRALTAVNGRVVFVAEDAVWSSDGTEAGTRVLSEGRAAIYGGGTNAYFVRDEEVLGVTDGTPDGTRLLTIPDFATGKIARPAAVGDRFYFTNYGGGQGLWTADGTPEGTRFVKMLVPHSWEYNHKFALVDGLTAGPDGRLAFSIGDVKEVVVGEYPNGVHTNQRIIQRWSSDGTEAGTRVEQTINLGNVYWNTDVDPSDLTYAGGHFFDLRRNLTTQERELVIDGEVIDVGARLIRNLTNVNDVLYFVAEDDEHGTELWTSDGTAAGTRRVLDLSPGRDSSSPEHLTTYKGALLFSAKGPGGLLAGFRLNPDGASATPMLATSDVRLVPRATRDQSNDDAIRFTVEMPGTGGEFAPLTVTRAAWRTEVAPALVVTGPDGLARDVVFERFGLGPHLADHPERFGGTFRIAPRDGAAVGPADDGVYTVSLRPGALRAATGAFIPGTPLGTFELDATHEPVVTDAGVSVNAKVPRKAKPGAKFSGGVTIENRSATPMYLGAGRVELYVAPAGQDDPAESVLISSWDTELTRLAAGGATHTPFRAAMPMRLNAGAHTVRARFVPLSTTVTPDGDPTNDVADGPTFTFVPRRVTSLVTMTAFEPVGPLVRQGSTTSESSTVRFTLRNAGARPLRGEVELRGSMSDVGDFDARDAGLFAREVALKLKPGESTTVEVRFRVPAHVDLGPHTIRTRILPITPTIAAGPELVTPVVIE